MSCGLASHAVAEAVVASMALHFVPCLWWTCDLGKGDEGQVRGSIWIVSALVLLITFVIPIPGIRQRGSYVETEYGRVWTAVSADELAISTARLPA
ncbi:uncharacterized protein AMSG_01486 [Thecamonas trahens ATCC 50062]|uniref:Uncharacterized protein n=1 Tax=Thecamonas trahens ATCC 50062 TaxID=461836 RepID=A0A0L0DQS6_THETB|nr:hypothetical protein AMSG_01486 [Thecamonas trahens ATCC 50062]KNC54632.1 hypothetical protein AMSG_01486 [Thecamonas trahens ATCC 50062]|eukprot:XP_013761539.1 hypothetical protein AMSG_01486 [Thecamonas trahens ATCC 50062]